MAYATRYLRVVIVGGVNGHQPSGLVEAMLADQDSCFTPVLLTRKPDSEAAEALRKRGAEVVQADLDDVESLKAAFAGAYGVYAVTSFWEHFSAEKEIAQAQNIATAAKAAGVKHVIWSTLEDTRKLMDPTDTRMPILQDKYRVPHFDGKAEANACFSEVPTTFLVTSFYWDNLYMFGLAPKKGDDGVYSWAFPMGDAKLAGIAVEDIGKCSYGIFTAGSKYIGKTVGITGENLTLNEISGKLETGLGVSPVKYNAVDADTFRSWGFSGADEMGNMFQVYRDFENEVLGARSAEVARELNPELQTFDQWLAGKKELVLAATIPPPPKVEELAAKAAGAAENAPPPEVMS